MKFKSRVTELKISKERAKRFRELAATKFEVEEDANPADAAKRDFESAAEQWATKRPEMAQRSPQQRRPAFAFTEPGSRLFHEFHTASLDLVNGRRS